jgi:hypothetical protein
MPGGPSNGVVMVLGARNNQLLVEFVRRFSVGQERIATKLTSAQNDKDDRGDFVATGAFRTKGSSKTNHCGQTVPFTQIGKFEPGYVQHVVPTPHCAQGQVSHPGGAR